MIRVPNERFINLVTGGAKLPLTANLIPIEHAGDCGKGRVDSTYRVMLSGYYQTAVASLEYVVLESDQSIPKQLDFVGGFVNRENFELRNMKTHKR
jgi:hypothetical protein